MTIRGSARRRLGILVPLGLGFLVAVVLAYQAYDAGRGHRDAVQRSVQDHADFAAYLLADVIDQRMSLAMSYAFYEENRANSPDGAQPAGPEILRQSQELSRCEDVISPEGRFFFRYSFEDQHLDFDGAPPADIRAWLIAELEQQNRVQNDRNFGHLIRFETGGRTVVAFGIRRFDDPTRTFAYGLNSCFRDHEGDVFDLARQTSGVLPPALVGAQPPDSLYTFSVLSADGRVLYGDTTDDEFRVVGAASVEPTHTYQGIIVQVALLPSTAAALGGEYPSPRLAFALALVFLSAGLMLLAVMQLRREQEVIRIRERFVGNVSHELRTPLQQILLYADLLRLGRVKTEPERTRAVEVIDQETRRLVGLVENVLQLSRGSNADRALRCAPLDLAELTEKTVAAFRPLADQGTSDIRLESDTAIVVTADPNAVRQILLNLLDNAVKYGPDGQLVTVQVFQHGTSGCLVVEDEGPGVPVTERERIWDSFYRLEREEQAAIAGSGIGLTIVKQLVQEMQGTVTVGDGSARGARFVVTLPGIDA